MSTARVLPWSERARSEELGRSQPRLFLWFPWWIAMCMVVVAYNSHLQLRLQQRLLQGSHELERVVVESRSVSAETNLQLQQVESLHRSTMHLDAGLERLGQINTMMGSEMIGLGQVAEAIQRSLASIDAQTAEGQRLLLDIVRESDRLKGLLVDSRRVGEQVSTGLFTLVEIQQRINSDLISINHKTRVLDRR